MKVMIIAPPGLNTHFGKLFRVIDRLEKPLRLFLYTCTFSIASLTLFGIRHMALSRKSSITKGSSSSTKDKKELLEGKSNDGYVSQKDQEAESVEK